MERLFSKDITDGKIYLGIEFGSTRIKAVLINSECKVIAIGAHEWENKLVHGIWTYELSDAINGMQSAYRELRDEVLKIC